MIRIQHGQISLALHRLAERSGPPLLLLHELGGSAADWSVADIDWPGAIYALDFCGHGESGRLIGAGYTAEVLTADADHALAHIGSAAVAGAGLGAYVALLLAGARPDLVPAALLLPGAGLVGGPSAPDPSIDRGSLEQYGNPQLEGDPFVAIIDEMVRPPEYSSAMAAEARRLLLADDGSDRPPWWQDLHRLPQVSRCSADLRTALTTLFHALPAATTA